MKRPISANSSSLSRKVAAGRTPSTCFALRPPTMAAVIAGLCSVHAIATTPALTPWRAPICFSKSASARLRDRFGSWKLLRAFAEVVIRHCRDALFRHRPGQQAAHHRRVADHADPMLLAPGQNLRLDSQRLIIEYGGCRLVIGAILLRALHLAHAEVGDADPSNFAFALQVGHRAPALFDLFIGNRPVDLVEIDRVHAEPSQAASHSWRIFFIVCTILRSSPQVIDALCEDVGFLARLLQRAADDLLGVSQAVNRCGIDPVDTAVQRTKDRFESTHCHPVRPRQTASLPPPIAQAPKPMEVRSMSELPRRASCRDSSQVCSCRRMLGVARHDAIIADDIASVRPSAPDRPWRSWVAAA